MDPVFWIAIGTAVALAIWGGSRWANTPSAEVVEALQAGVPVLDVRTPGEFAGGHVKGAMNIPHNQLAGRLSELGEPGRIVIYCRSGARSGSVVGVLKQAGFDVLDAKRFSAIPPEFRA